MIWGSTGGLEGFKLGVLNMGEDMEVDVVVWKEKVGTVIVMLGRAEELLNKEIRPFTDDGDENVLTSGWVMGCV